MLVEETVVTDAALPVSVFRDHLRLGTGFAEDGLQDGLLTGCLRAALASIEAQTGKVLLARQFSVTVTEAPRGAVYDFGVAPVSAITALVQIDANGAETALDPAGYRLVQDAHAPRLAPHPDVPHRGVVKITFEAGLGATWGDLPGDLAQAVLMLAAHFYETRTASGAGAVEPLPYGVNALIARHKWLRLTAGRRWS